MHHYPPRQFHQKSKVTPSLPQSFSSPNQRKHSVQKLNNWQSIFHIDRIKVKQQYECFPEYIYNTAFGSLLTGLDLDGDKLKTNNEQYSQHLFEKIPCQTHDRFTPSTQICNNSSRNDNHNLQQQPQSIKDIIKILVDFLGEFLLFLSSIIQCEQFHSQFQLQKMVDIAERIHQLRLTLLKQINSIHEHMINSSNFDISSISFILHELASVIHCLNKEQQQIGMNITPLQTIEFSQLLDRLEKTIKSSIDCVNMSGSSQSSPSSIPMMFPCVKSHISYNPTSTTECLFPCNGFNTCVPCLPLEQMRNPSENDHMFGFMYGIKDENIRRKLGYGVGKSPKRAKRTSQKQSKLKYKRNNLLNDEANFDSNQKWIQNSTHDQIPGVQQSSVTSAKEKLKNTKQEGTKTSTNSVISQKKDTTSRLNGSLAPSIQQSIINSKQSSPLFTSNSETEDPVRQRSTHDQLIISKGSERMTPHTTSETEELPITSMADHSESQSTSSRLNQHQQSDIYQENDNKSALWSPLSFQTSENRTPSKTTFKTTRESSQSLSPLHNQSINTQQSRETSSKKDDKVDSSAMFTSHDKIKPNESTSNKSFEQRLASPLSIRSPKQNMSKPISNKQLSVNETTSDFMFDNYSEHQKSPSSSFFNQSNDNLSLLNVIEGPQSAEGVKRSINASDSTKKYIPTSNLSPKNTHQQRSTSATSVTEDSSLFRTMENKKMTNTHLKQ